VARSKGKLPPAIYSGEILPPNAPPPRYAPRFAEQVREAAKVGYTLTEICRMLGVGLDTIKLWQMIYEEFASALRANFQSRTDRVEDALFQRAVGYEHASEKLFYDKEEGVIRASIVVHIPADVAAAQTWLKAHKPEIYVRDHTPEGDLGEQNKLVIEVRNGTGLPDMRASDKQPETAFRKDSSDDETL
jgi:hypothetical protein